MNDIFDVLETEPSLDASCPICDSPEFTLLGSLGSKTWLRCRCCGMDYSPTSNNE